MWEDRRVRMEDDGVYVRELEQVGGDNVPLRCVVLYVMLMYFYCIYILPFFIYVLPFTPTTTSTSPSPFLLHPPVGLV